MSWQYSARFLSATAHECYLEVSQLAAIAGRTSSIMQKNLADLEVKQMMIEQAECKVFGDLLR